MYIYILDHGITLIRKISPGCFALFLEITQTAFIMFSNNNQPLYIGRGGQKTVMKLRKQCNLTECFGSIKKTLVVPTIKCTYTV